MCHCFFTKQFVEASIRLDEPFLVATPTGENLLVQKGYRSCSVKIRETNMVADLMTLDMSDFDAILSMDWLASCYATIDCHKKVIQFKMLGGHAVAFQGDQSEAPQNLISLMNAR